MSTWHQKKNQYPLWHETQWTVVEGGPHDAQAVTRWNTPGEAMAHENKLRQRGVVSYSLPPMRECMTAKARR